MEAASKRLFCAEPPKTRFSIAMITKLMPAIPATTTVPPAASEHAPEPLRLLEAVVAAAHEHLYAFDREGRFVFVSEAAAAALGYPRDGVMGRKGEEIDFPPEITQQVHADITRVFATDQPVFSSLTYPTAHGLRDLEYTFSPMADAQGRTAYVIGNSRDVTERNRAEANRRATEEILRQSRERFQAAVSTISDLVWTNTPQGEMEGEQHGWAEYTGQSYDEYQGYGWAKAVHPADAQPTLDAWNQAVANRSTFVFEHRVRRRDGAYRLFAIRAVPVLNHDGTIREWVGVHTDVTDSREAEARLAGANQQLRRAMRETHHRVKNNLQLISALMDIQLMEHEGEPIGEEFRRLNAHVRAMAAVHDVLTEQARQDSEANQISAQAVLSKVIALLRGIAVPRQITAQIEDTPLSGKQGTSLALLVNELVLNALKHGVGDVDISFRVGETRAMLEVCDDGPGFPPDFNPAAAANTGLELVESVGKWDMNGAIAFGNCTEAGGGKVTITMPLDRLKP